MTFKDEEVRNRLSISYRTTNKKELASLRKSIMKLSYEETISELENILLNVQDENVSLDNIKVNYIKGHLLLKHCEELLECVEQEINEIDSEFLM
tara:strand:- start:269 stop:553 length:285 start_codon:yes stop_codon:yes gene_type:complete